MYTRTQGPGRCIFVIEEGDPIVLTNLGGTVVVGPHPAAAGGQMVIEYDGSYLQDLCWGVLNPDGTLGFQSEPLGWLSQGMNVKLDLDQPGPPVDHLTHDDRRWFKWVTTFR